MRVNNRLGYVDWSAVLNTAIQTGGQVYTQSQQLAAQKAAADAAAKAAAYQQQWGYGQYQPTAQQGMFGGISPTVLLVGGAALIWFLAKRK